MKFYSYEYLVGQVHAFSWLKAVVAAIVLIGVIVAIVRHNKDRYETKYRELIILGIIVILLKVEIRKIYCLLNQKKAFQNIKLKALVTKNVQLLMKRIYCLPRMWEYLILMGI